MDNVCLTRSLLGRLSVLFAITPDILAHREDLAQSVGTEIQTIMDEQTKIENRYGQLIQQRAQLQSFTNKAKYKENEDEIAELTKQLRGNTQNLCRHLKDNPNVSDNLLKIQFERQFLSNLVSKTVKELQTHRSFPTLFEHVESEKQAQDALMEAIAKEREATQAVKQLSRDLSSEKQLHEEEVASRNDTIAKLKEDLSQIRSETQMDIKMAQKEAKAKSSSSHRVFNQRLSQLEEEIRRLQKTKDLEERVNKETEDFLKRRQADLQSDIHSWSVKYETDMEDMETKLTDLKAKRASTIAELNSVTEKYKEVEEYLKECKRIQAERERLQAELVRQNEAAIKIQAVWRGYWVRSAKDRKKKGKGKKGGKKK